MKPNRLRVGAFSACLTAALLAPAPLAASSAARAQQTPPSQETRDDVPAEHARAFEAFQARVKEYVAMRERLEDGLPKLPKDATPEQIEAHKTAFIDAVRSARSAAKPGDLFTPELAGHIRAFLKKGLKPELRRELRETVLESEVKGVPLRVNYPYPESQELLEMPPTLLLKLPQLPKQVKYRYVGRNMLLVDRENGLIVDFMPDALP
jgi:hypothetical protein